MPFKPSGNDAQDLAMLRAAKNIDDGGVTKMKEGGKTSRVNEAGNYTKPGMRKSLFEKIKAGGKGGKPGQWRVDLQALVVLLLSSPTRTVTHVL
jgi:hypothetical protein